MTLDPALLHTLADFSLNLSAGWFGAAFIVPAMEERPATVNNRLLIENLAYSLAFLCVAYILNTI